MIILDTQVLIWDRFGDPRLGRQTSRLIERGVRDGEVAVSAISFWEIALLHEKGRLTLLSDVSAWRLGLLQEGILEIVVDGETGIRANLLTDFHNDPADRLIVATALEGHQLVTADRQILEWTGPLDRLDARE